MTGFNSKRQMAADKLQEPEREVLKLALEALEICYDVDSYPADGSTVQDKAIAAIKKALAQPPLPVQREWVGLTDEETAVVLTGDASLALNLEDLSPSWIELVKAVEAKLKEKNFD